MIRAGVHFHLGTEVTDDLIRDELPDSVVLATGPVYTTGRIEGLENQNVVDVLDVFNGTAKVGEKIAVWGNRKPG